MPHKARAGSNLDPTAADWNRMLDAADHYERTQRLGIGAPPKPTVVSTDVVTVKNNTGGNLVRGSVVELSSYLLTGLTTYDERAMWFSGIAIASPPGPNFAILRRPMPDSAIGEAHVFGRCIARVNVVNKSHICAIPKYGQSYLESSMIGPVRIIDRITTDTGVQECLVLLGQPIVPLLGVTTDAIGRTADATVTLVKRTTTGYTTWRDIDSNPLTIETRCFLLNSADTIPASRAVWIHMVEGFFLEVQNAWCADRTFVLEDEA